MKQRDVTTQRILEKIDDIFVFETCKEIISDVADKIFRRLETGRTGCWMKYIQFL